MLSLYTKLCPMFFSRLTMLMDEIINKTNANLVLIAQVFIFDRYETENGSAMD